MTGPHEAGDEVHHSLPVDLGKTSPDLGNVAIGLTVTPSQVGIEQRAGRTLRPEYQGEAGVEVMDLATAIDRGFLSEVTDTPSTHERGEQ